MPDHDVVVVGAGIVGLATAHALRERFDGIDIAVVDREAEVGIHQTSHNSGVIHSGVYYVPGSLKASLCVEGAREMYKFCESHAIPHERCGKLIVARTPEDLPRLHELERRGRANGVELRRLTADEITDVEPEARGLAALHVPDTGIVDYGEVARVLADQLRAVGATFHLSTHIQAIDDSAGSAVLRHREGEITARRVVACAGLWSDRLAVRSGAPADPRIVPFRGAYLRVTGPEVHAVRGMVYPVPNPELPFLGVHITRHISGDLLLGPTALLVGARDAYKATRIRSRDVAGTLAWPGTWRVAGRFWRTGAGEIAMAVRTKRFVDACAEYVPVLAGACVENDGLAGVRAQAVARDGRLVDDFVISTTALGVHVRNAPSPAATSAFAIGRMIAQQVHLPGRP